MLTMLLTLYNETNAKIMQQNMILLLMLIFFHFFPNLEVWPHFEFVLYYDIIFWMCIGIIHILNFF